MKCSVKSIDTGFGGRKDRIMASSVFAVSMAGIVIMVFIIGFLISNGLPVLAESSFKEIFTSYDWYPVEEPPALGMFPLIAGTVAATLLQVCLVCLWLWLWLFSRRK